MTVSISERLSPLYEGNGINTRFDFTFRVFDQEDANGVSVKHQVGADFENIDESLYSVTINPDNLGGYITFLTAPEVGFEFYIAGETPVDQQLDITNYDNFYPDAIERSLDKLTAILQEWAHSLGFERLSREKALELLDLALQEQIRDQGLALDQIDAFAKDLTNRLETIVVERGWLAELIADASGKNQQEINDLLDPKSFPDFYKLSSDIDDTASFKRLRDNNPSAINLRAGKEYILSETVILNKSCTVNGNGAVLKGTTLGIAPKQMTSVTVTEDFVKGAYTFKVADTSKLNVGDKVFLYNRFYITPWANIDEMLKGIALYKDQLGWTCQMNVVGSIDPINSTVTLELPCLEKGSATLSQIFKIYDDEFNFKDYTVLFDTTQKLSVSYNLACNLSSNVKFKNITNGQATSDTKNLIQIIHNYCYNVHYIGTLADQGTCIHFNYGTTDCSVSYSQFNVRTHSDGALVTYLGSNNFISFKNTFKYFDLIEGGVRYKEGAAIYFGAKTRNCKSLFDTITGFHIGVRVMFGAQDALFNNLVALNSKKDVSVIIMEDSQGTSYDNCTIDGSLYSVNSDISTYKSNFIMPFYAGSPTVPNAFTLTGSIPLQLKMRDCKIQGRLNVTAQLVDSDIVDCPGITDALFYNSNGFVNSKFNGNRCGALHVRGALGAQIKGNKLSDFALRGLTTKRPAGISLSGDSIVDIDDNDIVHESLGIENQNTNRGLNTAIKLGSNRIKAPTKTNIRITESLSPVVTVNNDRYISSEDLYRTDSDAGYWKTIGFSAELTPIWQYYSKARYIKQSYPNFSFPISANGTHTTTRTIANAAIGDQVMIDSTISPFQGRFYAKVTAADTVTIYYQDLSNTASTISTTVYLTVIK
ncbi:hypothetical protein [Acinetobacter baumannii]|uniref:hypothetical protein n=1 Tax=Acinetobacter baumannii TaxID=470 RepID=UPI00313D3759